MRVFTFLLFLFAFSANSFAYEVSNITVDLTRDENSFVEVIWDGFNDTCVLENSGEFITTTSISETRIKFPYSYINWFEWNFTIKCDWDSTKLSYAFPEIYKVSQWIDNPLKLFISWNNFWVIPNITVKWASYELLWRGDKDIVINLKKDSRPEHIYIEANWSKSNIYELSGFYPVINEVKSENWFIYPNDVNVCWENFQQNDNIEFWDKVIEPKDYIFEDWCFTFKMPSVEEYNPEIKVFNDYFTSKWVNIKIKQNLPKLFSVSETNYYDKLRKESFEAFVLKWENFSNEISKNRVYINWRSVRVYNAKPEQLITRKDNILPWDNFIYVSVNGNTSNYVAYIKDSESFKITNVEYLDKTNKWYKFKISFLWDLYDNYDDYSFNINRRKISPTNCYKSGYCEIYYNWKDYDKWEVYLSYKWKKITNSYYFGKTKYDEAPYVSHIEFPEWLWAANKILVYWEFLQNATSISTNNLFNKDSQNRDDFKLDGKRLTWAFTPKYREGNSSISVRSSFWGVSNSFSIDDIVDNTVYFPPYISNITTDDLWFISWWTIRVDWKWFSPNDTLIIDKKEIDMSTIKGLNYYWFDIDLPKDIESWSIQIKVRKWERKFSNSYKIFVQPEEFSNKIVISSDDAFTQPEYFKNDKENQVIAKYNLKNRISDVVVNELTLKVDPLEYYRWTYTISVNWRKYWPKILNNFWEAVFKDILIPFSSRDITLEVIKDSSFVYSWRHNIELDFTDSAFYFTKTGEKKYDLLSNNKLKKYFYVDNLPDIICYTNDEKNFCKKWEQDKEEVITDKEVTETIPENDIDNNASDDLKEDIVDEEEVDETHYEWIFNKRKEKEEKVKKLVIDFMPKYDSFIEKKSKWKQSNKDFLNRYYYEYLLEMEPLVEGKFPHDLLIKQLIVELEKRQK